MGKKTEQNEKSGQKKPSQQSRTARFKSEVPSVEKALDVLELLAGSAQGLTMNEMTEALDRTMGELYRIVVYLAKRDYIERNPETDQYTLTLKLFELSHQHHPTDRMVKLALPIMEKLAYRAEQSCQLSMLFQSSILILAAVPSPRQAGYSVRTGAVFPLVNTSSGVVILSFLEIELQSRMLSGFLPVEQESLKSRIDEIIQNGYERRESTMIHGILNLSAPVFDYSGVVAALTMGYIGQVNQRTSPGEALNEVVAAANELSNKLGGRSFTRSVPIDRVS